MAKETILKDNPVIDALKKLKEEEAELTSKLKPVQEAIAALEKIVEKNAKKSKPSSTKDAESAQVNDEAPAEVVEEA